MFAERVLCRFTERHDPLLLPFPPHAHNAELEIGTVGIERTHLTHSQPRAIEQLENRVFLHPSGRIVRRWSSRRRVVTQQLCEVLVTNEVWQTRRR